MKKILILVLFSIFSKMTTAQINLTSGVAGSLTGVPQSYNENRGVDVLVISPTDITIQSMTLNGFCTNIHNTDTVAYVSGRIYDPATSALLASGADTVHQVYNASITVPVAFTFVSGNTYRITFCGSGAQEPTLNSGFLFDPSTTPYIESSNQMQILSIWDGECDSMPGYWNIYVPQINLNLATTGVTAINQGMDVSFYPNPFFSQTEMTFSSEQHNVTVVVTDPEGRKIREQQFSGKHFILDREELHTGIYFVRLTDENKNVVNKKIVVR